MQGVQLAHDYSVYLGMPKTQSEVTIYIYHDTEKLISAYARETNSSMEHARTHWENDRGIGIAIAYKNHFFVNTSNEWYQNTKPKYRMKVIAHEFIHTYQNELSELEVSSEAHEVPEAGPRWLREGIAEYLAYKSLSEGGILSYESERNSRFVIDAKRIDKPLSEMEKQEGYRGVAGVYNHFLIAAELLAKNSGESNLLEYHALQNSKTTWQEAFEKAFGMKVTQFYDLFEKHKNAGFPEPTLITLAPTPEPTPIPKQDILDYVRWEIGSEVSLADQQNARHAVQLMHDYAVSLGMPEIKEDITFYLYHNHDALFAAYARVTGVSVDYARDHWADGDGIGDTGAEAWGGLGICEHLRLLGFVKILLNLMSVSAGEFVGALTTYALSELSWRSGTGEVAGPRWLEAGIHTILKSEHWRRVVSSPTTQSATH